MTCAFHWPLLLHGVVAAPAPQARWELLEGGRSHWTHACLHVGWSRCGHTIEVWGPVWGCAWSVLRDEGRGEEAGTPGLELPCRRLLLKGSCLDQELGVSTRKSHLW